MRHGDMAYDSSYTNHYRLPYFAAGQRYSAQADYERFVTLDRHLESYVGIVGVGVISGWIPIPGNGLSVMVGRGTGFINGYYSESGWTVIPSSEVSPSDVVIEAGYYTDGSGVQYDKVLVSATIVLPDDAECYLYAYRNANYIQESPYLLPDNGNPAPETSLTLNPAHSAVGFLYAASQSRASSSGRVFIGLIRTRSGSVSLVDTSGVSTLSDLGAPIRNFAKYILRGHRHGGSSAYDPPAVRLDVDRRDMILTASYDAKYEFTAQSSDRTSKDESHNHTYYADSSGDGVTVAVYGSSEFHYHPISGYVVGNPVSDSGVTQHIHTIVPRNNGLDDGWDAADAVEVYVNGDQYGGSYAVDASAKTVTFDGGITVKKRTYTVSSGDWSFSSEESSLYRFMLRTSIAYYTAHEGEASIILPDPATPISELKTQAIVGEYRLTAAGDTFTFVQPVSDGLVVTLSSAAHVDTVAVEILTNSEVQGRLPQDNILYIPASKIAAGEFDPERIPVIDHMGRFAELSEPVPSRLVSTDGRIYGIPSSGMPTDAKTVYAVSDDGYGNTLVSTACGLWMAPSGGAFLFSVNGVHVKTAPKDIGSALSEAVSLYTRKTGIPVVVDGVYDGQMAGASSTVAAVGDFHLFIGNRNPSVPGGVDRILLMFVSSYKLTDYGYEAVRSASDIKPEEIVVGEVPQEPAEDETESAEGETEQPPLYRVRNDFHLHTVKDIALQRGIPSGYSSTANRYFAVSSSGIFWSDDVDRKWMEIDESSASGYVYAMRRLPSGFSVMASEHGLFASVSGAARGFRKIKSPVYGIDVSRVELLPDGRIVAFSGKYSSVSDDYGKTWITSAFPSDVVEVRVDSTLDAAATSFGHTHTVSVDGGLDGWTSYDGGHSHAVSKGVILSESGHTHAFDRTMVVFCADGRVFHGVGGVSWIYAATITHPKSSWTCLFAAFGGVYVSTPQEVSVFDGAWTVARNIPPNISSATWSFGNATIFLGYDNSVMIFDGSSVTDHLSFQGGTPSSFYVDGITRRSTYANYLSPTVDFGGPILLGSKVDSVYDRSSYRPEQGGWKDGIGYDLYINDRLMLSTRSGIDRRIGYVSVDNAGYIRFSVSGSSVSELLVGETIFPVDQASLAALPESGTVRSWYAKSASAAVVTVFLQYGSKLNAGLVLVSPSQYHVPSGSPFSLVPYASATDDVRITVYDGKLTNVGALTHHEVEDAFERREIGLGKRLADVYLSNLLHLSVAADYAFPSVADGFMNTFVTRFDYNDIPGDPLNIDRFIDRTASDLASLAVYGVDGPSPTSSRLSTVVKGFGSFAGMCISASDSGLYYLNDSSLESNWIRVPGFSGAYDVVQFDSGTVYVAASTGLFRTSDPSLSSWTAVSDASVGGLSKILAVRWGNISSDDGTSYWWNKWDGPVHQNPDLVNTIIACGDGFTSFSDDKGVTWQDGVLYAADGSGLADMSPVSFSLLANGSIAMCARSPSGDRYGVYTCTGTGRKWVEVFSSVQVSGTVESMSVTNELNVAVRVSFAGGAPADGSLVGREIAVGRKSARVVANSGNTITAFGDGLMPGDGNSFLIRPLRMNAAMEDRQRRVHVATSNGLSWDAGGLFSNDRSRAGMVTAVGNAATVVSVDISGIADFAIAIASSDEIPRYRFAARLSNPVVSGEMSGWVLKFTAAIPNLTVVSNSVSKPDGSVDFVVSGDASQVVGGYSFTVAGTAHRLYVEYPGTVEAGDLDGGYLVAAPEESELGLPREDLTVFPIERNTSLYIQLSADVKLPEEYSFQAAFTPGTTVYCADSSGHIPMSVEFDSQRVGNELAGNHIAFPAAEHVPESGRLLVTASDETSVWVEESYSGIDADGTSKIFSVFNTVYAGVDFYLSDVPVVPNPSFADAYSSWSDGHRHTIERVSGPLRASVSSIASSTSSEIELALTGAWQLSVPWVQASPSLFEGAGLIAYDPAYPLRRHRLTVRSHGPSSLFVAREDGKIDVSGGDPLRVGPGWRIYMSVRGYGHTSAVEYGESFVSSAPALVSDALAGSASVDVADPSGIATGGSVRLESNGRSHACTVTGVSGSTVSVTPPLPHDFTVESASFLTVYLFMENVGNAYVTSPVSYGDVSISISAVSGLQPGDVMEVYDDIGGRYQFTVLTVSVGSVGIAPSPWIFDTAHSPRAFFTRSNSSWLHTHTISDGQFNTVSSDIRAAVGDSLVHGHYSSPVIDEVFDIRYFSGTVYAVGSGHVIQASDDNCDTWRAAVDLSGSVQFRPLPEYVRGIYPLSQEEIAFSTSSGFYVYQSDRYTGFSSSSSSSCSSSSSSSSGITWDELDGGLPDSLLEDVFDGGFPDTVDFDIEIDGGLEI